MQSTIKSQSSVESSAPTKSRFRDYFPKLATYALRVAESKQKQHGKTHMSRSSVVYIISYINYQDQ